MCGIVALITKHKNGFTSRQVDIFNTMLYIDALRGEDSTGAFCVSNLGNVEIVKEAWESGHTLRQKEYKEFTDRAVRNGWAMVGHNRKATKGSITDDNAHPFWVEDKVVLVHNGTMYGDHKQHKEVDVDSHAIAHLIAEKDTLEEALGEFSAAYALVWYDIQKKRLNFLRNSQRPLHYFETEHEIVYASEAEMISFVAFRERMFAKANTDLYPLKEMTLVSHVLQDDKSSIEEVSAVVPKVRPGISAGVFSHHGYGGWESEFGVTGRGNGRYSQYYDDPDYEWPASTALPLTAPSVDDNAEVAELVVNLAPKSKYEVATIPTYPWTRFHTLEQFEAFKKMYEDKTVSVECMDYLNVDDASSDVLMMGRTNDTNNLCVVFHVNNRLAARLTDPDSVRNKENRPAMFNVMVDVFRWKKHKEDLGVISIVGKDALLTLEGMTVQ